MATSRWTEAMLDQASTEGDNPSVHPNADELASKVMSHPGGVHRYNHMLDVADAFLASPALALARDSALRRHLEEFSPEGLRYFEPAPAPDWVDEAKLKSASLLWEDNSVAAIAVLYALSLPCTYLYKKGVPALYETGKLTKHEYIFQRIHETGIFVDDVMDEDGIEILEDYVPDEERLYLEVLKEIDPKGAWQRAGHGGLVRSSGDTRNEEEIEERVEQEVEKRRGTKRFLWGRGYLAARKVRFLHASIRFMLLHPEKLKARAGGEENLQTLTERLSDAPAPWDKEAYGKPINQEELAFGLLSFGYLIPMGLERWGCGIGRKGKEAFLHHWRVVGHIMGIRDDLMTDDWDEATDLLALVMKRQAGGSDFGRYLTEALMTFAQSYFPHLSKGLRSRLPAHAIMDQLGRMNRGYPAMILPPAVVRDTTRLVPRTLYGALMLWTRLYYTVRERLIGRIPLVGETLLTALHRASEDLIGSWRDQFRRQPFDLSGNMAWVHRRGADKETAEKLQAWRRRVFNNISFAIVCLFAMVAALVAAGVFGVIALETSRWWRVAKLLGLGSVVSGFVAWLWMTWWLPKVLEARPRV
jgi:ER-bound oxygenase mpaB/B'/Rubber oxygenase, catalytic domain